MIYKSISQLSELTGFDRRTVKKRLAPLEPIVDGRSHRYETIAALRLLYTDSDQAEYDLNQERARLSFHQANNEALKEKERKGELMPVSLVGEFVAGIITVGRSRMLSAHNKIKSRYPELPQEIVDDIEEIHREALQEMATSGIPEHVQERVEKAITALQSAAESDDQPMG